ncbi:MAG TPA: hypothetical protein VFD36_25135, partial [Kofleriaceae bacterium]|nr:hypothetical protein [Kofleriaceae bacterium]
SALWRSTGSAAPAARASGASGTGPPGSAGSAGALGASECGAVAGSDGKGSGACINNLRNPEWIQVKCQPRRRLVGMRRSPIARALRACPFAWRDLRDRAVRHRLVQPGRGRREIAVR